MSPRWLTASELGTLVDHGLRLRQIQVAESALHSQITTVAALYDAARRTHAIHTYAHLLTSRRVGFES